MTTEPTVWVCSNCKRTAMVKELTGPNFTSNRLVSRCCKAKVVKKDHQKEGA